MLGLGSSSSPYIIQTPQDLHDVRNKIGAGIYYELGNDIDMANWGNFTPIGSSSSTQRFKASFNGKGYSIKNLKIVSSNMYTGFVVFMDGSNATIQNVSFIDADISSTANYTAVIAGANIGSSKISNCYVSGNVKGGMYNTSSISGINGGIIENCFSTANITGSTEISGITRMDSVTYAKIISCYFNGTLNATNIDGKKYGVTHGVTTSDRMINSYYNMDSTGLSTSDVYGFGLSDKQMKEPSSFVGFNSSIWTLQAGKYPYLTTLGEPEIVIPAQKKEVTVNSHSEIISVLLQSSKRQVRVNVSPMAQIRSQSSVELLTDTLSHIDEIVSEVQVLKNANIKSYQVDSYIDAINSKVYKSIRTKRTVESGIEPIKVITDIVMPIQKELPTYAEVQFITNQSLLENRLNQIQLNNLLNQSNLSNQLNQTNITYRENRTEIEVV